MKIISVYYNEIKLGELTQENKNYIYKANIKNIMLAHKKGYCTYLYNCDEDFTTEELPYSLQNFIPNEKQTQIIQEANILNSDSDFEKLYKIAKLPFEKEAFNIQA